MKSYLSLLCILQLNHRIDSFSPVTSSFANTIQKVGIIKQNRYDVNHVQRIQSIHKQPQVPLYASTNDNNDDEKNEFLSNLIINPIYALPYLLFILVAGYQSSVEPTGASTALIEKFIADPVNPGVNTLFCVVFNYLGLIAFPMGCLLMPGAKGQSLPAPPFIIGSMAAGYGSIGLYMSTRKSMNEVNANSAVAGEEELGFVTKNILENKIFNWIVVGLALSTLVATGFIPELLSDTKGLISGFGDVLSSSALGAVSTLDLIILTLTGASVIPEDLERRGVMDSGKANAIAASTILLPVLGLTLYCALRPALSSSEK